MLMSVAAERLSATGVRGRKGNGLPTSGLRMSIGLDDDKNKSRVKRGRQGGESGDAVKTS